MGKTLVKTIGAALLTTAIALTPSCIATYPLGTTEQKPEMVYRWTDENGVIQNRFHNTLITKPKLRESYERCTGKTFVP